MCFQNVKNLRTHSTITKIDIPEIRCLTILTFQMSIIRQLDMSLLPDLDMPNQLTNEHLKLPYVSVAFLPKQTKSQTIKQQQ